jgi:TatD DNase family protein
MTGAYFDTHCHLQDPAFAGRIPEVVERARAAGVTHMVCCATRETDWDRVLELAREQACILPMLGLHPWFAAAAGPGWLERLRTRAQAFRIGIGECGLDFSKEHSDRSAQEAAFEAQVRLAIELHRPLSIHCVRAWGRLLELLRRTGIPAAGGALHAFSGSAEVAAQLQELGLYLAQGPGAKVPAALPTRLLYETDAPGQGDREPAQVAQAAGPEAAQVQENARRLFRSLL